jgi:hypothetical protein
MLLMLRPISEDDIIQTMNDPLFRKWPQDEIEMAGLFNRLLETKLSESLKPPVMPSHPKADNPMP